MNALEFIVSCLVVYAIIYIHKKYGTDYLKMLIKEFGFFILGLIIIFITICFFGILLNF